MLPTEVPLLAAFVTATADMPTSRCVIAIFKSAFRETVDDVVQILVTIASRKPFLDFFF